MVSEDDELAPASRLRLPSPGPNSCSYTGCTQHSNATAPATTAPRRHGGCPPGASRANLTDRQHSSSAAAPTSATT